MKKIWWVVGGLVLGGCLLVVVIIAVVTIYLGAGFNWSSLLSLGGPRDLGVRYT